MRTYFGCAHLRGSERELTVRFVFCRASSSMKCVALICAFLLTVGLGVTGCATDEPRHADPPPGSHSPFGDVDEDRERDRPEPPDDVEEEEEPDEPVDR